MVIASPRNASRTLRGLPALGPLSPRSPELDLAPTHDTQLPPEPLSWLRPLHGPRRKDPPPICSVPSTRADVRVLNEQLQDSLRQSSALGHSATDETWHKAFVELVRQVYVHCNERGELLDAARIYYEEQLRLARRELRECRAKLRWLLRENVEGGGALERQRLASLVASCGQLRRTSQVELITQLLAACPTDERVRSLLACVTALGPPGRLGVLQAQLEGLDQESVEEALRLFFDSLSATRRSRLLHLLFSRLDGAEKGKQALSLAQSIDTQAASVLAQRVVHALDKIVRQPTVAALVGALSREERHTTLVDAVAGFSVAETAQLGCARLASLDAAGRNSILSEEVETMPRGEQLLMVQQRLVAMTRAEREPLLTALFGTMLAPERAALHAALAATLGDAPSSRAGSAAAP